MKPKRTFIKLGIIAFLLCIIFKSVEANNVKIDSNPIIINTDANNDYSYIQFDISWENSWRDATNWDAVWVFIKYQVKGDSLWRHAYLSTNALNHSVGFDFGVTPAFSVGTTNISGTDRGMGVFVYRNANGTGNINWDQMNIRWNYGENGVPDDTLVTVKVFAIEMVYVPQGNFYVGDGTVVPADIKGQLHEANNVANPFQITSENAITLGGIVAGNLGNNNTTGMNPLGLDDFNNVTTQTLPASFPKGYNAFYCAKYETSQEQWVDFLNCLSRYQQSRHTFTNTAKGVTAIANRYVMTNTVAPSFRNGVSCDATVDANNPIAFYCDLNNNSVGDEVDDGQTIACNMINWADVAAYADWIGIRFITQLEFEKACRGPVFPVVGEAASGVAGFNQLTSIVNAGREDEAAGNSPSNNNVNSGYPTGPVRCGMFATATTTRVTSGGSFYGIMSLTGNVSEKIITIGNATGRTYNGIHGDGMLGSDAYADVVNWPPNATAVGSGTLGSSYAAAAANTNWRVSTRTIASLAQIIRVNGFGFRGVRTAP